MFLAFVPYGTPPSNAPDPLRGYFSTWKRKRRRPTEPPTSVRGYFSGPAAKGPQNTRKKEARGRFSAGISRVSFERQRTEGFQWVKARGRFSARVLRVSFERGLSLVGTLLFNAPYPIRGYFLPWAQFHNRRRGARASPGLLSYFEGKTAAAKAVFSPGYFSSAGRRSGSDLAPWRP